MVFIFDFKRRVKRLLAFDDTSRYIRDLHSEQNERLSKLKLTWSLL